MSKYTTEVRFIVENACGLTESEGYKNVNTLIAQALPKVFDFEYPVFDTNYKSVLETKILKHYYTREIGLETVGLWKLHLDRKMNEIMPYYNKLYLSELIKINPLYTDNLKKSGGHVSVENKEKNDSHVSVEKDNITNNSNVTESNNSSTKNNINSLTQNDNSTNSNNINNTENINKYSDTPSGGLNGVLTGTYLTNASQDKTNSANTTNTVGADKSINLGSSETENKNILTSANNSNSERSKGSNTSGNTKENFSNIYDYLEGVVGHTGVSESKLLMEYRETFLNIDMMIINELSDLFMNLW